MIRISSNVKRFHIASYTSLRHHRRNEPDDDGNEVEKDDQRDHAHEHRTNAANLLPKLVFQIHLFSHAFILVHLPKCSQADHRNFEGNVGLREHIFETSYDTLEYHLCIFGIRAWQ